MAKLLVIIAIPIIGSYVGWYLENVLHTVEPIAYYGIGFAVGFGTGIAICKD